MNKIILIILIFINMLFASTHIDFNKDNQIQKQDIFKTQAQEIVQSLIFQKNTSYLFLDNKSIKRYYKTFNYELIWIDGNGVKNIALELLSSIQNDPVLKHQSNEAFKLNEVVEQLRLLDKSNEQYIQSLSKIDFMLTGIYDRYMKYLSNGFINWELFKEQRKIFDEKEEINSNWEKYTSRKNYKRLLFKAIKSY